MELVKRGPALGVEDDYESDGPGGDEEAEEMSSLLILSAMRQRYLFEGCFTT